jgi:hypothetical protein
MNLVTAAMLSVAFGTNTSLAQQDAPSMQQRMEQMEQDLTSMRSQIDTQAAVIRTQEAQIQNLDAAAKAQQQAKDVDKVVNEVLSDARARSELLADSGEMTAGYNNGFFISSGNEFMLRIRGLLMTRYTYNHQSDSGGDDDRGGFELARTRFGFFGHVIDPSWQFVLWTGYASDGGAILLDTYIKKTFEGGWSLTVGQYKVPFWREWLISETRLPMAERSLVNKFSGSYTQGVMLGYEKDKIHAYASISDGLSALNSGALTEDVEGLALTGRVEWLAAGKWGSYGDFEAWPGEDQLVVLGASVHYQNGEYGTTNDEASIFRVNLDGSVKWQKLSALGAIVANYQDNSTDLDQYGALLQLGYFINRDMEAHLRYEWGTSDLPGEEDLSIVTIGIDRHWAKHQVRVVFDLGYSFNSVSSFWANSNAGWRTDAADENGQIVVRSQFELNF